MVVMVSTTSLKITKIKLEKSVSFKSNSKNKRRKNSNYLLKNVKKMKKCSLYKVTIPVCNKKLIA